MYVSFASYLYVRVVVLAASLWRENNGIWNILGQSAAQRHLSFNADCSSEPPQYLSLFTIIFFLTIFGF